MRVGDEWREWPAEPECVVFDDSFEHEVGVLTPAAQDCGEFESKYVRPRYDTRMKRRHKAKVSAWCCCSIYGIQV